MAGREAGMIPTRSAVRERTTRETTIRVSVDLDGSGRSDISTGVGFYDHLLTSFAHHSLIDIDIVATGDLHIDEHHTVEDVALVLGDAISAALGDRVGISRFGDAVVPMDDALASVALDLSGRPYPVLDLTFRGERVGAPPRAAVPFSQRSSQRCWRPPSTSPTPTATNSPTRAGSTSPRSTAVRCKSSPTATTGRSPCRSAWRRRSKRRHARSGTC
jgi:imidazoleglycerol phosphate dehydratase HisB